ncbi:MAG TPA: ATP-dependent DNA helicase, partial [Burkholderiaceae bacterium]|nr:ATP-dependent DNA helicase [Burkholderiaceae bacterium]
MSYAIAVRALCEFTAREGDLDLRFTPAPSALEGIAGHSLARSRRGTDYETEVALAGRYEDLLVRGRADGFDPATGQLEEIKTYRGRFDGVRPHHRALHWAQARIYGHLLCQARGLERLRVALVYFDIGTQQETVLVEAHEAAALQAFFEDQCARFLAWARSEAAHREARDAALTTLQFPMERFRPGQRDLAVAVYRCARSETGGRCLMAQAPTGIGKTLGTIFPMLKACPGQGLDKLFYLTAKGTGRGLALQALATVNRQLAEQARPDALRVLDMQARDKTCEHPAKACHGESCPLARGFFDRLPAARAAVLEQPQPWDAPSVRAAALAHHVCPYYLSQEMLRWSDVVVADYNYYYDGAAILHALTQAQQWKAGVLVDEAHNLLERARRMYTAELSPTALADARKAATGPIRKALDRLHRHWNALSKTQAHDYQAYEQLPAALLDAVQRAVASVADAHADTPMLPGDPVLTFHWDALRFIALADQFGSHSLFDVSLVPKRPGHARTPASVL